MGAILKRKNETWISETELRLKNLPDTARRFLAAELFI
jgi:hypothetical protein